MFISRVKLTNWKNFTDIDITLAERIFIVGPNASGKSNLLDVFRFLRDIARDGGGLQEAVRQRGGLSKIRCLSARAPRTDVEIEIDINESPEEEPLWKYQIGLTQKGGGAVSETRAIIRFEKVWKGPELIIDRPKEDDKSDEELLQYTHLEQPTANSKFRELADFFKSIDYQHIIPQIIRNPVSFQKTGNTEEFFGRDLFEKMSKMPKNTRESQLKKIEAALKSAVPNLKNLTLEKDKMGMPHLQAIYEHWRPHGAKQNEEQFSDGTLRLIGLFYSMLNGSYPLLLEEPELSLHSGVVQKLAEIIHFMQKRKSGKRQVILSTHSYDLLNNTGINPEEIIILKPVSEGTDAKNVNEIDEVKKLLETGLSPAEAVLPFTEAPNISQLILPFQD
ncbi:MAG TPA: AAA family ATPase [Spirochaetota bacterium]|nr:AAA family ATPase [Spirochaetota bacterium]HQP49806.1 AAA family ATPase [Spirochaetota bacterium]